MGEHRPSTNDGPIRIGAVSFLNTRPLIEGLGANPRIQLRLDVPSRLPKLLESGQVDVALIPVVDLHRQANPWSIVSDACIASEGDTLTVRVFSRVPPEQISVLHADTHSHTSAALAQLIWMKVHRRPLELRPLPEAGRYDDCEAVLLIGDKVVTANVRGFGYDIDLGGAWRAWTGLPFVFAVWAGGSSHEQELAALLSEARDLGVQRARQIAERDGPSAGWPVTTAIQYLTRYLSFTLTPRHRQGLQRFLHSVSDNAMVGSDAGNQAQAMTP